MKMMQSTHPRKPGVINSEAKVLGNCMYTSHGFICNQETSAHPVTRVYKLLVKCSSSEGEMHQNLRMTWSFTGRLS